ncbi:MAG: heavy metal translocating P-type ATPase metal-binding domain-containing protein [Ginsengibacter sp.]
MQNTAVLTSCYHCSDPCDETICADDKVFCCNGCKQVYLLLSENGLCNYYDLSGAPGIKAKGKYISEKYAYLDDPSIINKLLLYSSERQNNVSFHLPQIHCSSCIFLLENLHKINEGVIKSVTDFQKKEVFIIYNPQLISLRKVVELLAFIGYEPALSFKDAEKKKVSPHNRKMLYKIGIAGFCFSNIMMLSFPEYLSGGHISEMGLKTTFSWLNLALSLPVLFYSASEIFVSAWKGLRQKFLNIDAPIALAIIIAFGRSYFEIISGQGAGFLDSATGIIFFMLVGRWFQNKTYDSFSFDRDYKSYFPLGVTILEKGIKKTVPLTQLKVGNRIVLRNEEMIPADAILINGNANIDYSFVSGENTPLEKEAGDLLYAGGKQVGGTIELETVKDVSQSYITQLWNNEIFNSKKNKEKSFIHPWSRYFTIVLFSIAFIAVVYWWWTDASKIFPVLTAVLIIACPCSLLLSATFTYGNMLRILGKNKFYLKNAGVIEALAKVNTLVFDKTGTITQNSSIPVYEGFDLSVNEMSSIKKVAGHSGHPLSRMIGGAIDEKTEANYIVENFKEYAGIGIEARVDDQLIRLGSAAFAAAPGYDSDDRGTSVHITLDKQYKGKFSFQNTYRKGVDTMIRHLQRKGFDMHVLSGDNEGERQNLALKFGTDTGLHFNQTPQQKLNYINGLQEKNKNVLMLGDGLNDAGALMKSNVGIAVSDNTAQFSPACDGILDGTKVGLLDQFIAYAHSGKKIVTASFILSILYNVVGLSFAVSGHLSPMVAAILMPASSISIVLLVTALSSWSARKMNLLAITD